MKPEIISLSFDERDIVWIEYQSMNCLSLSWKCNTLMCLDFNQFFFLDILLNRWGIQCCLHLPRNRWLEKFALHFVKRYAMKPILYDSLDLIQLRVSFFNISQISGMWVWSSTIWGMFICLWCKWMEFCEEFLQVS